MFNPMWDEEDLIEMWAERLKVEVVETCKVVARPGNESEFAEILASAWVADCPTAHKMISEMSLSEKHMVSVLNWKEDIRKHYFDQWDQDYDD